MKDLFPKTNAYKIMAADKKKGNLSHAYLLNVDDGELIADYLVGAAKLVLCKHSDGYCNECRDCKLIDARMHSDVSFYPKDKKLSVADADDLVAQSVVRPLEADKRVFAVERPETLNQNQNKLLKTLEEPPKNVVILLGSEKPSAVLPTIRSRAKKIDVPLFPIEELLDVAKDEFKDEKLAKISAMLAGGKAGLMEKKYRDESTLALYEAAVDFLAQARSARDLPAHLTAFSAFDGGAIISAVKLCVNEMLKIKCGYKAFIDDIRLKTAANGYPEGALLAIVDKLNDLEMSAYFNGNQTMLKDGVLFAVLEERAKWLRL